MRSFLNGLNQRALVAVLASLIVAPPVQAGPVIDWLLGVRRPAPTPVGAPVPLSAVQGYGNTANYPYYSGYGPAGIPQTVAGYFPNAGYSTQLNRAPVTYYRPVTALDPSTGTTVTRMQPCTSYELETQRIPMLAMRPALGSYPFANRYPSITAPTYGATPVPSNAAVPSTNYLPSYGVPVVPSYTSPTIAGQAYASGYWPGTAPSQGVVPAGAYSPVPFPYPVPAAPSGMPSMAPNTSFYPGQAYGPVPMSQSYIDPTLSTRVPYTSSYGAYQNTYGGCTGAAPLGSNNGLIPGSSFVPNPTYPGPVPPAAVYPNTMQPSTMQPGTIPFGSSSGNVFPNAASPFSAPGQVMPSIQPGMAPNPSQVPNASGSFDAESQVMPRLNQSSSVDEPSRFRMRSVTRDPISNEGPMQSPDLLPVPAENPFSKSLTLEPSATSDLQIQPQSDSNRLTPIPAPDTLDAPRWNPGLLDARDRTAQDRPRSFQKIQWISSAKKSNENSEVQRATFESKVSPVELEDAPKLRLGHPLPKLDDSQNQVRLQLSTRVQPPVAAPSGSVPSKNQRYDASGWSTR